MGLTELWGHFFHDREHQFWHVDINLIEHNHLIFFSWLAPCFGEK